jgi:hypothetical protein
LIDKKIVNPNKAPFHGRFIYSIFSFAPNQLCYYFILFLSDSSFGKNHAQVMHVVARVSPDSGFAARSEKWAA